MRFQFHDHGPLIDRELELVQPDYRWIDAMLLSSTPHEAPNAHHEERSETLTRQSLIDFLRYAPHGRHTGDGSGIAPSYSFWMRLLPQYELPVPMGGRISLRISNSYEVEMYYGHMGYNVHAPARGHHFAERACRLLVPLAKSHGLNTLWITCNPDNLASRRTCERLSAKLIEVVPVPAGNPLYQRGDREKCRYRWEI